MQTVGIKRVFDIRVPCGTMPDEMLALPDLNVMTFSGDNRRESRHMLPSFLRGPQSIKDTARENDVQYAMNYFEDRHLIT